MKKPALTVNQMEILLQLCQMQLGTPTFGKNFDELMNRGLIHYDEGIYRITENGSKLIDSFKALSTV